jgi:hypothetical protein
MFIIFYFVVVFGNFDMVARRVLHLNERSSVTMSLKLVRTQLGQ